MISLDSALKIFNKYGYNSKTVHPYLFKKNKEIGVKYSYIDSKYGVTERVASFHSDLDLENFLKKYQWYKLNGKKAGVTLKLNNYEISNPEVLYIRNNHVMTDEEIFNMEAYDKKEAKNKKLSHTKRMLVEVENLVNHYYFEKEQLGKYTNNLFNKERELTRYYVELQKLVNKYNKVKWDIDVPEDKRTFKSNLDLESKVNSKLAEYKKKLPKVDKLNQLVVNAWILNKELEENKDYMYALKVNDDIDEEMRLVVTKIDYMKELLSKKRRWKIVNLKKIFQNIDKQSTYESIYDEKFENKYKDFIEKKYDVLDKISELKLSEYLNNFKTNKEYDIEKNIQRCMEKSNSKKNKYDASYDDISNNLKKQYKDNLNDDEKYALTLYTSTYKDLFDLILDVDNFNDYPVEKLISTLNKYKNYEKYLKECFHNVKNFIDLDENKEVKDTIFKNVNFDSEEEFIESIRKNVNIIIDINSKMKINNNYKLYFSTNDFDNFEKNKFIVTSSIIAPLMYENEDKNYRIVIADIKKGANVLFSLQSISLPIAISGDTKIKVVDIENPEIILDTRDVIINKDSNMVVYSRFKTHTVESSDYTYVDKFVTDYKLNISKVLIEKRD